MRQLSLFEHQKKDGRTNKHARPERTRLNDLRNRALAARYYYWSEIRRIRFDDVLDILEHQEFFLKSSYIIQIIRAQSDYIDHLQKNKITKQVLRKHYPGFNF